VATPHLGGVFIRLVERLLVLLELEGRGVVGALGISEGGFVGFDLLLLLQSGGVVGVVGVREGFQVGSLLCSGGRRSGRSGRLQRRRA
jgi:hypothetical protein